MLREKRITDNTLHSITANLARVLTKRCALLRVCCEAVTVVGLWLVSCLTPYSPWLCRGTESGCHLSVEVLTQQLPPSKWLEQAFLALAFHHCREGEEAGRGEGEREGR